VLRCSRVETTSWWNWQTEDVDIRTSLIRRRTQTSAITTSMKVGRLPRRTCIDFYCSLCCQFSPLCAEKIYFTFVDSMHNICDICRVWSGWVPTYSFNVGPVWAGSTTWWVGLDRVRKKVTKVHIWPRNQGWALARTLLVTQRLPLSLDLLLYKENTSNVPVVP